MGVLLASTSIATSLWILAATLPGSLLSNLLRRSATRLGRPSAGTYSLSTGSAIDPPGATTTTAFHPCPRRPLPSWIPGTTPSARRAPPTRRCGAPRRTSAPSCKRRKDSTGGKPSTSSTSQTPRSPSKRRSSSSRPTYRRVQR